MILKSEGRFIEVIILRRIYPERTDFEDANWLESEIKIDVPGFKGLYGTNLRTDDFERFYKDLEKLKTGKSSKVEFTTMEEGLHLEGLLDITGNVKWIGTAKSSWGGSCLTFKIETDNASIDNLLKQMLEILNKYPIIGTMFIP
jgi:hypothetical protein